MDKPVAIIGGGFAGLVAARELVARGVPVRVFEAADRVGGLAQTVTDENGFSFDFGAHFITNRLADELGASHLCRLVPHYGEAVVAGDRTYKYPFGFSKNFEFVTSLIRSRLRSTSDPINAVEQMEGLYGEAMAAEIAVPLLEGWSGVPASELAPAVAEKLDEGVLKTAWLKTVERFSGKAIAIGYTREVPSSSSVWHVYPEGGLGSMIRHLADELGDVIEVSSPIQSIIAHGGAVSGVVVNGEKIEVAAAMSTAPVNVLSKLVEGTDALDHLARFRYRPMVFVNLLLEGRGYLPDTLTWFTDKDLPFFRLTEPPLSMSWLAPEGKTTVMADLTADLGDEVWSADDDELAARVLEAVERVYPAVRGQFIGSRVLRTPLAYPIFLNEYEPERQRFEEGTGVAGLYSIGRNGEFAHILMEDVYWRTKRRVGEVVDHLSG